MTAVLQLDGVVTYRGPAQILRQVALAVHGGESVCLVGRNGAGKTTTIDTIMGLLTARSGRISFQGQDITRLPAHERARLGIGYAPEDCGIFPDLTVEENFQITEWLTRARAGVRAPAAATTGAARPGIAAKAGSGGVTEEQAFGVFPEVRSFLKRRGLHLSGGQKKMVAITRAMTLSPSILLLDEPFEGLAPVVVTRFIEAVRAIKTMGISVLIAESNLTNAARVADRLYAIDRGEIIFEGHPRDVLQNQHVLKTIRG